MINKLIYLVCLVLVIFNLYQCTTNNTLKTDLKANSELIIALNDSIHYHTEKDGTEAASKRVLVARIGELEKHKLTQNQKKLVKEVKSHSGTVSAVQIGETVTVIDQPDLKPTLKDSSLIYSHKTPDLAYTISVKDSTLRLDTLQLFNSKTVLFREDRKSMYVTVKNSNPYFKTAELDSYQLPKKRSFFDSRGFKIGLFVTGVFIGSKIF